MCLENLVKQVVIDFINSNELFTSLDISNELNKKNVSSRHSQVRELVRDLFDHFMVFEDYARTLINVNLSNGSTVSTWLYHPLNTQSDLDQLYDSSKRNRILDKVNITKLSVTSTDVDVKDVDDNKSSNALNQSSSTIDLWNNLFNNQPSLFPKRIL